MATTFHKVKNNAYSTLASGITAVATSLTVATGEGARFPSTFPFYISIDSEILSCSNRVTDTLTVSRAEQSTTGATHSTGAAVNLYVTAGEITQLQTAVNTAEATLDRKDLLYTYSIPRPFRAVWEQFNTYDMYTAAVTATGTNTQQYMNQRCNSAASGDAAIQYQNTALLIGIGNASIHAKHYFGLTGLSVVTIDCVAFAGFAPSDATYINRATTTAHAGWIYEVSGATYKLYAVNGTGGARTETEVGAYQYSDSLEIIWNKDTSQLKFYRNGALVATHTTNIPTATLAHKMCLASTENGAVYIYTRPWGYISYTGGI